MRHPVPSAGALLPCPPLLVPELAGGAASELDELRSAALEALAALAECGTVVAVAAGPRLALARPGTPGTLQPFGVPIEVALPAVPAVGVEGALSAPPHREGSELSVLPPSLAVLAWLLGRVHRLPQRLAAVTVPPALPAGDAAAIGERLAEALPDGSFAVLAVGDLSARRTLKAPGTFDARAGAYDAGIVKLLAEADLSGIARLAEGPAAELRVDARAPLQVMAGALRASRDGPAPARGRILYDNAPYGVGYVVALLSIAREPSAP